MTWSTHQTLNIYRLVLVPNFKLLFYADVDILVTLLKIHCPQVL